MLKKILIKTKEFLKQVLGIHSTGKEPAYIPYEYHEKDTGGVE